MTLARIGRFQVLRTLGSGTFATVWLARDDDLDALVAIKLLGEAWSRNDDARRRFIDEARALRQLDDERIVRVYEVGRLADDRPYMVMEYADRGTLEDRIQLRAQLGQQFSVPEALELATAMAGCLIAVHDHRIVHRDVKPSNVLFRSVTPERGDVVRGDGGRSPSERVLLGDFGIARRLGASATATMVVGSPHYMAPEQADPDRARFADERSDVYSAAVILFELLIGRVPLHVESIAALQRSPADVAAPVLRRTRPDVPPDLARAIHRGMDRDPDRRYRSARAWMEAIAGAEGSPGSADGHGVLDLETEEGGPSGPPGRGSGPVRLGSGGAATAVRAAPPSARTLSLDSPARTDVLPDEPPPPSRPNGPHEPTPLRSRRFASAMAALAGGALLVSPALPWVSGGGSSGVRREVAGTALDAGGAAAVIGALLVLCAWRLWRTRRRWLAITWSSGTVLAGLAGLALGTDVELAGLFGSTGATRGSGLITVWAASALALVTGWAELRRLGRGPASPALGVRSTPAG